MSAPIDNSPRPPAENRYYAAQGNASRLFFRSPETLRLPDSLRMMHTSAFATFAYLLSGGLSKPAFYPAGLLTFLRSVDSALSRFPRIFGGRCLVVLQRTTK